MSPYDLLIVRFFYALSPFDDFTDPTNFQSLMSMPNLLILLALSENLTDGLQFAEPFAVP
jgi:hypothetical protein